jgi:arsenite methyltransferase
MKTNSLPDAETIREHVRERYGAIARQGDESCGCAATGCCGGGESYGEKLGYSADQLTAAGEADLGLGCGNPLDIAGIRPGETVLDLGSGAGFDCLLAARQLAGTGQVIGVDMTPAMVTKARAIAAKRGLANLEFRLGEIEALPVPDRCVDLIISNCVINLSPDKPRVLREAFRVLKPGGRLAIADVVATKALREEQRAKLAAIGACIGGAAQVGDWKTMLAEAGFVQVKIELRESSRALIAQWTDDPVAGEFVVSALVTAYKPAA